MKLLMTTAVAFALGMTPAVACDPDHPEFDKTVKKIDAQRLVYDNGVLALKWTPSGPSIYHDAAAKEIAGELQTRWLRSRDLAMVGIANKNKIMSWRAPEKVIRPEDLLHDVPDNVDAAAVFQDFRSPTRAIVLGGTSLFVEAKTVDTAG